MNARSTSVRESKHPPREPVRTQYFDLLTPAARAEKRPRSVYILNKIGDTDRDDTWGKRQKSNEKWHLCQLF